MNNRISMGYFLAVAATVIWAGNFIVARALNQDILPTGLAFWRWAIAVETLASFTVRSTIQDWKLVQKYLPYLTVSMLLGVTAFNTSIYVADRTTQALKIALIATSSLIFIVLMSRLLDLLQKSFHQLMGRARCPSHKSYFFLWDGHLARPNYFCKRSILWRNYLLNTGSRYDGCGWRCFNVNSGRLVRKAAEHFVCDRRFVYAVKLLRI
ncbi:MULTISPECIES: DMT family transporter [unclassified Microcoleus]|uniref:DMT family transporter n=1 Tax=unclassified Microcoleus TaxID=2642155 RepID=UPI002FCFC4D0